MSRLGGLKTRDALPKFKSPRARSQEPSSQGTNKPTAPEARFGSGSVYEATAHSMLLFAQEHKEQPA